MHRVDVGHNEKCSILHKTLHLIWILPLFFVVGPARAVDFSPKYEIGVYYFPGWKEGQRGAPATHPWERIKKYPDREPLLGWYQEGDVDIAEQQIAWMHQYGIDYVVFDWYWDGKIMLDHALSAYMAATNKNLIKISLLWANHSKVPVNLDQFTSMIDFWIKYYFPRENYLKVDGKPVIFIMSQESLRDNAKSFGKTTSELLHLANEMAKRAGFQGIYFVGGAEAVDYWVKDYGPANDYDAFSIYNYHRGFSGVYIPLKPYSHSYSELDMAYRESWDWILNNSPLPYIVPMTSGWDARPWSEGQVTLHDNSFGTPEAFEAHLKAAKSYIDKFPDKTRRMGVICCWNEYGEGSYIEPTKKYGLEYLEKIRKVFGAPVQ